MNTTSYLLRFLINKVKINAALVSGGLRIEHSKNCSGKLLNYSKIPILKEKIM